MSLLSIVLPTIGQPDSTEDPKIVNAYTAISTWANGNIDASNMTAAGAQAVGANQSAQTVKGSSIVATTQTTTSTSFTTLGTPDQVSSVVLATAGLLRIWYQATWVTSSNGTAQAAIFVGSNQLKVNNNLGVATATTSAFQTSTANQIVSSYPGGLISTNAAAGSDVTTGEAIGVLYGTGSDNGNIIFNGSQYAIQSGVNAYNGGPCDIFAAAGTYTISVQFLISTGTLTVSNRRLYVQAISFT